MLSVTNDFGKIKISISNENSTENVFIFLGFKIINYIFV